jgi:hypothetical protein
VRQGWGWGHFTFALAHFQLSRSDLTSGTLLNLRWKLGKFSVVEYMRETY